MSVAKLGQIRARVGKGGQILMGQTDRAGWLTWEVGGCGYACRSRKEERKKERKERGGCGWVWASLGQYGQSWAKVGRSGWVRLIGRGWVTWEMGRCGYVCRSRGGCGWVWASLGR